jgi:hypothetical protein
MAKLVPGQFLLKDYKLREQVQRPRLAVKPP